MQPLITHSTLLNDRTIITSQTGVIEVTDHLGHPFQQEAPLLFPLMRCTFCNATSEAPVAITFGQSGFQSFPLCPLPSNVCPGLCVHVLIHT